MYYYYSIMKFWRESRTASTEHCLFISISVTVTSYSMFQTGIRVANLLTDNQYFLGLSLSVCHRFSITKS
jgi:hypothetical protein